MTASKDPTKKKPKEAQQDEVHTHTHRERDTHTHTLNYNVHFSCSMCDSVDLDGVDGTTMVKDALLCSWLIWKIIKRRLSIYKNTIKCSKIIVAVKLRLILIVLFQICMTSCCMHSTLIESSFKE